MKLSVVTLNLNNLQGLKKTFNSIINLIGNSKVVFEVIIVEGGSTDGSQEYINENSKYISQVIIDKHQGIYSAMNDGIDASTGDYLIFMNSGDYFHSTFNVDDFFKNRTADILFGKAINKVGKKEFIRPSTAIDTSEVLWWKKQFPCHQATFISRNVYRGRYFDVQFKICADSKYLFSIFTQFKAEYVDEVICVFELGGVSSQQNSLKQVYSYYQERRRVHGAGEKTLLSLLIKFILQKVLGLERFYKYFY
jgi:glycosyltransferase involved in cell wall biosynthesis